MDHEGVFLAFFGKCKLLDLESLWWLWLLDPQQGSALHLLGDSKCPPRTLAEGSNGWHNIHTSCDLQTTDSGKTISVLMGKLGDKWVEIIKNAGKTQRT